VSAAEVREAPLPRCGLLPCRRWRRVAHGLVRGWGAWALAVAKRLAHSPDFVADSCCFCLHGQAAPEAESEEGSEEESQEGSEEGSEDQDDAEAGGGGGSATKKQKVRPSPFPMCLGGTDFRWLIGGGSKHAARPSANTVNYGRADLSSTANVRTLPSSHAHAPRHPDAVKAGKEAVPKAVSSTSNP